MADENEQKNEGEQKSDEQRIREADERAKAEQWGQAGGENARANADAPSSEQPLPGSAGPFSPATTEHPEPVQEVTAQGANPNAAPIGAREPIPQDISTANLPPGHPASAVPHVRSDGISAVGTLGSHIPQSMAPEVNNPALRRVPGPDPLSVIPADPVDPGAVGLQTMRNPRMDADVDRMRMVIHEARNAVRDFPHQVGGEVGQFVDFMRSTFKAEAPQRRELPRTQDAQPEQAQAQAEREKAARGEGGQ